MSKDLIFLNTFGFIVCCESGTLGLSIRQRSREMTFTSSMQTAVWFQTSGFKIHSDNTGVIVGKFTLLKGQVNQVVQSCLLPLLWEHSLARSQSLLRYAAVCSPARRVTCPRSCRQTMVEQENKAGCMKSWWRLLRYVLEQGFLCFPACGTKQIFLSSGSGLCPNHADCQMYTKLWP